MRIRPQYANFGMPSIWELIIVIPLSIAPWLLAIWFVRYLLEMSRERRRLRLEVSKLAHELEGLRTASGAMGKTPQEPSA